MKFLVLLLIIIPALEIAVLIFSGNTIGLIPTVLLIITTGLLGAWLAKQQGLETLRRAQEQMRYGQVPGGAIIDGLCILVGGVLLLTPGFITDGIGFSLLIPATRNLIKPFIQKIIRRLTDSRRITIIR
ncbi:membrane protein FxsA [Bacillus lacus]|uniref:Membrane protein FxsA n=1 Tax=Metabacillus lacus TaxID=1983721 RepID=A0A7X2LXX0_9BACI|nr:FxsA family protein [Metabacillus lacus]MRX71751.1 membrane protein FxsA [Metabacillus lacus]